jgi:hypothetical protein
MSNQIAETIRTQIGHKALYMIGAKNLLGHDDALSFKIGRNSKSVNYIKITLTAMDLYDIKYSYVTKNGEKIRNEEKGLYADMMHDSIERNTGMYTSL